MKTLSCTYLKNCIFVVHKQFKRNLKLFFYDKELPAMGSNNESVVLPVLDCLCSPKAVTPHTNLFSMHKKKQFVTSAISSGVTPSFAFFQKYFSYLSTSLSQTDAFAKASMDYFNLYQEFLFPSFNHFKTSTHGKNQ